MSLEFAHGDLAWNSADAVTTNYTVSGLTFQPKALKFLIMGQADSTDAATETTSARVCIGFATSTSSRRCMGFLDVDAAGSADTQEIYRADAVLATVSAAGAVDGLLDITAINSDGFVLTVDDTAPVNLRVFWFAWGGADILNAQVGEITEPAAAGNQTYAVTDWLPNAGDNAIFIVGCQLTGAAPTAAVEAAGLTFGVATTHRTRDVFSRQMQCWGIAINSDEASGTMDTDRYFKFSSATGGASFISMIPTAGGNPNATTTFVDTGSTGFTINWNTRAVTGRRYMYLAIQGGSWYAGTISRNNNTIGNTQEVPDTQFGGQDARFPVKGALLASFGDLDESTAGTSDTGSALSIGCFSSTSSRRAMGYYSEDATANAEVNLVIEYDAIIAIPTTAGALDIAIDVDAVHGPASGGFRVIVDTAGAFFGDMQFSYVMFGDTPHVYTQPVQGIGSLRSKSQNLWSRAASNQNRIHQFSFQDAPAVQAFRFRTIMGVGQ